MYLRHKVTKKVYPFSLPLMNNPNIEVVSELVEGIEKVLNHAAEHVDDVKDAVVDAVKETKSAIKSKNKKKKVTIAAPSIGVPPHE